MAVGQHVVEGADGGIHVVEERAVPVPYSVRCHRQYYITLGVFVPVVIEILEFWNLLGGVHHHRSWGLSPMYSFSVGSGIDSVPVRRAFPVAVTTTFHVRPSRHTSDSSAASVSSNV